MERKDVTEMQALARQALVDKYNRSKTKTSRMRNYNKLMIYETSLIAQQHGMGLHEVHKLLGAK